MTTIPQILKNEPSHYKDTEELYMAMNNKTTKTCPVCETQNTVVIN